MGNMHDEASLPQCAQDINLRELTKKYGRGIGLNVAAVRAYAAQMLTALYHLRNCGVLHADIKPDNILVRAWLWLSASLLLTSGMA